MTQDVRAMTDVTGFGLLGHGLELARGGGVSLEISYERIPFLAQAEALAQAGYATGASGRNWASYGDAVVLPRAAAGVEADLAHRPANVRRAAGRLRRGARRIRPRRNRSRRLPARRIIGSVGSGGPAIRII